jgi:hypothetical protein
LSENHFCSAIFSGAVFARSASELQRIRLPARWQGVPTSSTEPLAIIGSEISALGQKRTNHRGPKSTFVRFGPIADKRWHNWIVRFLELP